MLPKVIKRDGVVEKFSIINIGKVAMASGLTPEQAKSLAESMSRWAESLNVEQITSVQIRDKMIEELGAMNQNAKDLYQWYEQSKENAV